MMSTSSEIVASNQFFRESQFFPETRFLSAIMPPEVLNFLSLGRSMGNALVRELAVFLPHPPAVGFENISFFFRQTFLTRKLDLIENLIRLIINFPVVVVRIVHS